MVFAKRAFHQDFSPFFLGHVKLAIVHGYILANQCMYDNDFLKAYVGRRNRSHLQNTAVEFAIKNRAERFGIDLSVQEANNSRGTFPHYNFYMGSSIFTVSRTPEYDAFPRDAIFRSMNSNINSQMEMINRNGVLDLPNDFGEVENYYAILTFGGKIDVDFMHFGIPNSDINRWLYQYNLGNALAPLEKVVPEREEIAETTVAAVKDQYIKRQEVSGSE